MANPTTNYGWQMPTPTDLVTDLPADFEVFGQAVDTALIDLKGGTTGQVLSKTTGTDMDFTWVTSNPGDITGVTAGTGISGGGTSGDVTVTNSMATTIDAKGDLIGGTADNAFARLAVGANNTVLTADSTTATGLKWAAAAAAAQGVSLTASSQTVSVTNNVFFVMPYTTEAYDTDAFHDNSTNTTRITIPTGLGGKYLVFSNIANSTINPTAGSVGYRLNGTAIGTAAGIRLQDGILSSVFNAGVNELAGSIVMNLAAGDYIEAMFRYVTPNGNLTTNSTFGVIYLGA